MTRTVCHYPWNTMYIEPGGEVYPCCHKKPYPIGNLNEKTMNEILLGPEAERVRDEARRGTLSCFATCTRAPSRQFHRAGNDRYSVEPEPGLKEVHINITTRCNIACLMCRQDHKSRLTLSAKRLIRAVDWSSSPRLTIQGGEPLVAPSALKLARFIVADTGSVLTLITNGLALTRAWEDVLLARANECRFSLNGASSATHETVNQGSRWPKVIGNVRRLADRRAKESSPLYLTLRMTVVPENAAEMPEFVRFANREGYADRIAFGFDRKTVPKWARKNPETFQAIYQRFLEAVAESKTLCDCWRMYQLARRLGLETRDFRFGRKGQWLAD